MERPSRLFRLWLVSYLSVLVVPIAFSVVFFSIAVGTTSRQIDESARLLVEQIRQSLDGRLREVTEFGTQLAFDRRVELAISEPIPDTYRRFTIAQMVNQFQLMLVNRSAVETFYFYSPSLGAALTPGAMYPLPVLQSELHNNAPIDALWWVADGITYRDLGFYVVPVPPRIAPTGRGIAWIAPIPLSSISESKGSLVVFVRLERIFPQLDALSDSTARRVIVRDRDGTVLVRSHDADLELPLNAGELRRALRLGRPDQEEFVFTTTRSEVTGWEIVVATPRTVYQEPVSQLTRVLLLSVLGAVIVGLLISYLFAIRQYRPLHRLAHGFAAAEDTTAGDEYSLIANTLERMSDERSRLSETIRAQETQVAGTVLIRALLGEPAAVDQLPAVASALRLPSQPARIWVAVFTPSFGSVPKEGSRISAIIDQNRANSDMPAGAAYASVLARGWPVMILTTPNSIDDEAIVRALTQVAETIQQLLGMQCIVALGTAQKSWSGLGLALQEAIAMLAYQFSRDRGPVLRAGARDSDENRYPFTLDVELQLIDLLRTGDAEGAKTMVFELLRAGSEKTTLSVAFTRFLMHDIAGAVFKAMHGYAPEQLLDPPATESLVDRILNAPDRITFERAFIETIDTICARVKARDEAPINETARRIQASVNENLCHPMMSVSWVADQLGIHPDYASRVFHASTGQLLHDYVASERIARAKVEMRASPSLSIRTIAESCGFTSATTFARTFKKHAGMTPQRYRDMHGRP